MRLEVHENVKNIGSVRNRFAHSHVAIDFTEREVARLCNSLKMPSVTDQERKTFDIKDHMTEEERGFAPDEQLKFILSVTFTHMTLAGAAVTVQKRAPKVATFGALVGGVAIDDPSVKAPIIFYQKQDHRPADA